MKDKARKITAMGALCALAYTATAVGRVPLVLFLKYDPKDAVIAAGGLVLGPLAALAVSLAEMLTISENGVLGWMMNVISSCSFACTAALVYRRRPGRSGAALGLLCGWGCMIPVMLLWNYLAAPIYMGCPREAVAELLLPAFLIKGGLNAALALALYRPAVRCILPTR